MKAKLWEGRFSKPADPKVERFTASISFDKRLYPYDIQGSMAHVQMLAETGIIKKAEAASIQKGLKAILKELDAGTFKFEAHDEDIHMSIERRLHELIGPVAGKMHTARSRNDQVILDVRLFVRDMVHQVQEAIRVLQQALVSQAEKNMGVIAPGFTHMQHAQPILISHHFMAYFQMLDRDYERFSQAYSRINVLPLGAGAMAGSNFPIDRHRVAEMLEFPKVSENSMDTVADRDFVLDFLSASAIMQMHLSRMAEELVYWSSMEFRFVQLPDEFCTGSSIMPQKKNPDVAELTRGKTGRIYGNLMSVLTTMKGLPLTYNSDMQEDKPPLFDTCDNLVSNLAVMAGLISGMKLRRENLEKMAKTGYITATNLANYLADKGIPFREAHFIVGAIVKHCEKKGIELEEMDLKSYQSFNPKFEKDVYSVLTLDYSVESVKSYGGTSPESVKLQISKAKKILK
jgi:argininosuccinate lyase